MKMKKSTRNAATLNNNRRRNSTRCDKRGILPSSCSKLSEEETFFCLEKKLKGFFSQLNRDQYLFVQPLLDCLLENYGCLRRKQSSETHGYQ